jgi:hypothetical protein
MLTRPLRSVATHSEALWHDTPETSRPVPSNREMGVQLAPLNVKASPSALTARQKAASGQETPTRESDGFVLSWVDAPQVEPVRTDAEVPPTATQALALAHEIAVASSPAEGCADQLPPLKVANEPRESIVAQNVVDGQEIAVVIPLARPGGSGKAGFGGVQAEPLSEDTLPYLSIV